MHEANRFFKILSNSLGSYRDCGKIYAQSNSRLFKFQDDKDIDDVVNITLYGACL